jgi:hypothetical protein
LLGPVSDERIAPNRSSRLATAAIFNYTLLAKVLVSGANFANPQAAKLRRWAAEKF